ILYLSLPLFPSLLRLPPRPTLFPYTTLFRSKARECALQALYQLDTSGGNASEVLTGIWSHFDPVDEETKRFAEALVRGAQREQRSEEHTSELQSRGHLVCRLLLEKKKQTTKD